MRVKIVPKIRGKISAGSDLLSHVQACCVKVGPGDMLQLSQQLFAHS